MDTVACTPCCGTTTQTVEIPGSQGDDGIDGSNGTNAYTTLTSDLVVPAIGANVTASVADSTWMAIGQIVVIDGPANFKVVSKPNATSVTLEFQGYSGDVSPGATISSGANVSPGGTQFTPTQPAFAANRNGSDQTALTNATAVRIEFQNEVFDNEGDYDTATYRFTPSVAGIYDFTVAVAVKAMVDQTPVVALLYKNGVAIAEQTTYASGANTTSAMVTFRVEANGSSDYFEAFVKQTAGGVKDLDGTNTKTYFQGNFVAVS